MVLNYNESCLLLEQYKNFIKTLNKNKITVFEKNKIEMYLTLFDQKVKNKFIIKQLNDFNKKTIKYLY